LKKWISITNTMTEFKIVEIVGRRIRDGKEECQVQWAVTWEPVDEDFRKGELYREFMADLEKEARESAKDADEGGDASSEEKEEDAKDVDEGGSASSEEKEEDAKDVDEGGSASSEEKDAQKIKETKADNQGSNFCPRFLTERWATGAGAKRPGKEAQRGPRVKNT
jgi:hypothetical protein